MQMMRGRCGRCSWEFDLTSLPGEAMAVCRSIEKRHCPICYSPKVMMADSRPLTDDERTAKAAQERLPLASADASELRDELSKATP